MIRETLDILRWVWSARRYRYGLIIPVLLLTTGMGIWAWVERGPLLGLLIILSPAISTVLTVIIVWWITWLSDERVPESNER